MVLFGKLSADKTDRPGISTRIVSVLWIKLIQTWTGVDKLPNLPLIADGFYGKI